MLVLDYDLARGDGLMHCMRVKRRSRPPAVPRDAYEAAVATLDDEDLPVLAMLLDGTQLDAMAQPLGKSRIRALLAVAAGVVGRLRPGSAV